MLLREDEVKQFDKATLTFITFSYCDIHKGLRMHEPRLNPTGFSLFICFISLLPQSCESSSETKRREGEKFEPYIPLYIRN